MTQLLQGQLGAQDRPHPAHLLMMDYLSSALAGWELGKGASQMSLVSLAICGVEAQAQDISVTATL